MRTDTQTVIGKGWPSPCEQRCYELGLGLGLGPIRFIEGPGRE